MSLPVGSDIESICGKCGDVWHVVEAKVGDKIARVVCKQCGGRHRYKPPEGKASANTPDSGTKAVKEKKAKAPRKSSARAKEPEGSKIEPDMSKPPRVYKPDETYAPGERMTHPSFGTGVVEALPGPGKVQVFFPGGRRVLAIAKAASTLSKPSPRGEGGEGGGGKLPHGL
jgi:predicted  nucleic acid-binding Zn-ribbon protein